MPAFGSRNLLPGTEDLKAWHRTRSGEDQEGAPVGDSTEQEGVGLAVGFRGILSRIHRRICQEDRTTQYIEETIHSLGMGTEGAGSFDGLRELLLSTPSWLCHARKGNTYCRRRLAQKQ